ncbi:hypothetical protein U062_02149 [Gammaproteobacteria bacterium MOLA455]|nr:hypothetical protein U062_02149 [Gammaproteobacteria bacterium MOLA455]
MKVEKDASLNSRATRILSELHSPKASTLITEHDQRRAQILKGIAKGECDIDEGRCFTHCEAQDKLKIWLE